MKTLDRIRRIAESFPDRIAYQIRNVSLRYGALWRDACRLAEALAKLSCTRIILFGEKEPEMLIGMIGCLLAGKTYVPLTASAPEERIRRILRQLEPCEVLSDIPLSGFGSTLSIRALLEASADPNRQPEAAGTEPLDTEPAYILFTSGSSGQPKGVPIGRENLDNFTDWICGLHALRFPDPVRVLNQASFSFDLSVADIFYALCSGHTLISMPPELSTQPAELSAMLKSSEVSAAICTPSFLKLCLLDRSFCSENMPLLRVVYSCGEVLEKGTAAKLLDRFPGLRLLNAYGPTEATSAVCAVEISREMTLLPGALPVGRLSSAACRIEIESGEIVLKGKSVFQGYFQTDHAEVFTESGTIFTENGTRCFRTGDYGRIDGDLLYFEGRKDRQIKWMGYRIELDEIERIILEEPTVEACAVTFAKTEEGSVRLLRCYVCLQEGHTEAELRSALCRKLPTYMIPKMIRRINAMPVNENGKIDRKKLDAL